MIARDTLRRGSLRRRLVAWSRIGLQAGFIIAFLVLLTTPMRLQTSADALARPGENRALAPPPPVPANFAAIPEWPSSIDKYLQDHFGLRNKLVDAYDTVLFRVFGQFTSMQIVQGRGGRIFLASHDSGEANRNSLIRVSCGFDIPASDYDQMAREWGEVLAHAAKGPDTRVVLVPTAAALFPNQLPPWLSRLCATGTRPAAAIKSRLPEALSGRVIDPYSVLAALPPATPGIPLRNFHWDGYGPARVADFVAHSFLGRPPIERLAGRVIDKPSDLSGFFPGLGLTNPIFETDVAAAGIEQCLGDPCFEALGTIAPVLNDMRKYRNPRAAGRVLLITDSFGAFVASSFAPYYHDVWQFSINGLPRLTPAQQQRLREHLFGEYAPDTVLLLFHDGAAFYAGSELLREIYPD